jgi:hypothetical protein
MPLGGLDITKVPKTALVFADIGCGKTHLLATAQERPDWNPLLVDADGGSTTLIKFPGAEDYWANRVFTFDRGNLMGQLKQILKLVEEKHFNPVMFDTITFFMQEYLTELCPTGVPEWGHYHEQQRGIFNFMTKLMKLSPIVIFTAFEKEVKNRKGEVISVKPSVSGTEFPRLLMTPFTIIGRLTVESFKEMTAKGTRLKRKFTLNSIQDGFASVRDRTDLTQSIENPTLTKLFAAFEKGEFKNPESDLKTKGEKENE